MPRGTVSKNSIFKEVNADSINLSKSIWHEDDVILETMIAHVKILGSDVSSTMANESMNLT